MHIQEVQSQVAGKHRHAGIGLKAVGTWHQWSCKMQGLTVRMMKCDDVQAAVPHATSHTDQAAFGFVFGDGTVTAVDASEEPARLFGSRQFLGWP